MAITIERASAAGPRRATGLRTRNPTRAAAAALVVLISALLGAAVVRQANTRQPVLMLARDIPAGDRITEGDLQIVSVASDSSFRATPSSSKALIVGRYAKVRMVKGSLLVEGGTQTQPLVTPNFGVVSIQVPAGAMPAGVREQSRLDLVLVGPSASVAPRVVRATAITVPSTGTGSQTVLSVEVPIDRITDLATASKITIVLLNPAEAS